MSQLERDAMRARSFRTVRTVSALMLREMATTYGRSAGGYAWALLEPVGAIALLSFVFSFAFRTPSIGTVFALFYATGYLPFMLYNDLQTKVAKAINFSRPLLAYPSVTYTDAILARFVLNLLTQLMVFYIVMAGVIVLFDVNVILDIGAILNSLCMAAVLGLGVGTLNCFLMMQFPVWQSVWSVLNRPMFIISGLFFLLDDVPPQLRDYLWWNPLIHVTGEMRKGFYATYDATYVSDLYVYGVGLVCLAAGLLLLGRYHREILNQT